MAALLQSIDFYAHHSPFGAFASFTLGRLGKGGGFGMELGGPAKQDIFIGVSRPGEGVTVFPFFTGSAAATGSEAYTGGGPSSPKDATGSWQTFAPEEIQRSMGWATDTWQAGPLAFSLVTPFGPIPDLAQLGDGELRRHLCPAIFAEIVLDNTASAAEAFAFFGVADEDPLRPLSFITEETLCGIARAGEWGFAIANADTQPGEAMEVLTWSLQEAILAASSATTPPIHRLANRGGLLLRAAPGEKKRWMLALGFYRSGIATSGIAATYLYTRLFPDLESVLRYALENAEHYLQVARSRDRELEATPLPDARKFLLAHATHSYHGATMLLHDEKGVLPRAPFSPTAPLHRPLWVVNEGEYRMLNTFDLTVDHAFWEMRFHPWSLKNALDLFVGRYSYTDELQNVSLPKRPRTMGGLSFTHDMGVANQFSPPGNSSYELPNLDGCFSYMTHEQLCNWCLCAALYALPTPRPLTLPAALPEGQSSVGDLLWLAGRRSTLHACLESLIRRDGSDGNRDGVMSLDSMRCGTGQEITTYDSLDTSLGQARGNIYLAVKTWAAYLALSRCFDALGEDDKAVEAEEQAARAAETISQQWLNDESAFPAVFDSANSGYAARIVPAVEALVYPLLLGDLEAISPYGPYGELISNLRRHLKTVLVPGVCVDEKSGGIKLSSSSTNTWMSKTFLCQFVAERVLGLPMEGTFDEAHVRWQCEGGCRDYAFTDQVHSPDGLDLGSRYYPRGVTSILWII